MNWCLIIIGIIFISCSFICMLIIAGKSKSKLSEITGFLLSLGIVGVVLLNLGLDDSPKAIDVYNNKTELRITYTIQEGDTLQRDSVVVWKNVYK